VASVHDYKRLENNFVQEVKGKTIAFAKVVAGFLQAVGRAVTRRYTVVFVPHSEKKVYNFNVSILTICCVFLVVTAVTGTFIWHGVSYRSARVHLSDTDGRLREAQANLDQIRDEVGHLFREVRNFEPALAGTLATIGADLPGTGRATVAAPGDLSSFFDIRETPVGMLQEVDDLRRLAVFLTDAATPIREIGSVLDAQGSLLTEIPSIWPIAGGAGRITMPFGRNQNPFTGQYYIHRGIDIATGRQGDAVVATADGQVIFVGFDRDGFGNNIIIRHRHGFFTRYAHLLSSRVRVGQRVQQGEIIGYLGNTGLSTAPHLHYEVHIGSDVVDPYTFLNIRPNFARIAR
jgi:murein DD-endopeptidase MepM/ murein hydrolase activator NlpD